MGFLSVVARLRGDVSPPQVGACGEPLGGERCRETQRGAEDISTLRSAAHLPSNSSLARPILICGASLPHGSIVSSDDWEGGGFFPSKGRRNWAPPRRAPTVDAGKYLAASRTHLENVDPGRGNASLLTSDDAKKSRATAGRKCRPELRRPRARAGCLGSVGRKLGPRRSQLEIAGPGPRKWIFFGGRAGRFARVRVIS